MAVHQIAQNALIKRYATRRIVGKAGRAIPWIGIAFALMAVASAVRRKGVLRGALDTALNAVPVVGGLKCAAESIRGRDFFPDRRRPAFNPQRRLV
jgi:hypothetical protein